MERDRATTLELIVVWLVSIVVFGFTGWISITKAVELAGWLGLA